MTNSSWRHILWLSFSTTHHVKEAILFHSKGVKCHSSPRSQEFVPLTLVNGHDSSSWTLLNKLITNSLPTTVKLWIELRYTHCYYRMTIILVSALGLTIAFHVRISWITKPSLSRFHLAVCGSSVIWRMDVCLRLDKSAESVR